MRDLHGRGRETQEQLSLLGSSVFLHSLKLFPYILASEPGSISFIQSKSFLTFIPSETCLEVLRGLFGVYSFMYNV